MRDAENQMYQDAQSYYNEMLNWYNNAIADIETWKELKLMEEDFDLWEQYDRSLVEAEQRLNDGL